MKVMVAEGSNDPKAADAAGALGDTPQSPVAEGDLASPQLQRELLKLRGRYVAMRSGRVAASRQVNAMRTEVDELHSTLQRERQERQVEKSRAAARRMALKNECRHEFAAAQRQWQRHDLEELQAALQRERQWQQNAEEHAKREAQVEAAHSEVAGHRAEAEELRLALHTLQEKHRRDDGGVPPGGSGGGMPDGLQRGRSQGHAQRRLRGVAQLSVWCWVEQCELEREATDGLATGERQRFRAAARRLSCLDSRRPPC